MTERAAAPVRVMLVEDNAAVRRAVAALLATNGNLQVCAEAATVAEAGPLAAATHPDVVIIDLRLPDGSGVLAGRDVRSVHPAARVLLLTSASEEEALAAAMLVGASAFLVKRLLGIDLIGTVRAVAGGDRLLNVVAGKTALDRLRSRASAAQDAHILGMLADGWTDLQIAQELGLDEAVVRDRVAITLSRFAPAFGRLAGPFAASS